MAGFATRVSFAGHPSHSATADHALTFNPDHLLGAGQWKGNVIVQGILKKTLALMSLLGLVSASGLLVNLNSTPGHAQEIKGPHLADLMNEAMQVHHAKLWFAGHASNWALAAYEVRKIKETIVEIKETIVEIQIASPQWQRVPVGEMLTSFDSNLDAVDQAVKAKNAAKFDTAYHELTATCNACHTRAGQPQIRIIDPLPNGGSIFPDQDFTTDNGRQ